MSTTVVTGRIAKASPQVEARAVGALWLTCIVTIIFAFVSESALIARDDAAATAANILANELLFRLGLAADVISGASYLGLTALLYRLLRPAGGSISLVAAFFGLCGVAVGGMAYLARLAPLVLLRGDQYLGAFTADQLQAMAFAALKLQLQAFSISTVFFGTQCVLAGCLIARSTFLPRVLGVMLAIGGSGYVFIAFANFLEPSFAARLTPFFLPLVLAGEGSLTVWLLAKGVDVRRWEERAGAATGPAAGAPLAHQP
jgi:hypothetical protein